MFEAEALGVKPWELDDMPPFWGRCALTLQAARNQAEQDARKREKRVAMQPAGVQLVDDIDQLRAMGAVKD